MVDTTPIPEKVPQVLDVLFSGCIDARDLQTMHRAQSIGSLPGPIRQLVENAGADDVSCVYELTPSEVARDDFGLAREFAIHLRPDVDTDTAIEMLKRSGLVERVAVVGLAHAS